MEKCSLVTPRKCTNHKGNHLPSYNCPRLSSSAPLGQWSVEFCAACGQRPCSVDQDGLSIMRQPGLGKKRLTNFFFFCEAERLGRSDSTVLVSPIREQAIKSTRRMSCPLSRVSDTDCDDLSVFFPDLYDSLHKSGGRGTEISTSC